jgi:hypothetical protein
LEAQESGTSAKFDNGKFDEEFDKPGNQPHQHGPSSFMAELPSQPSNRSVNPAQLDISSPQSHNTATYPGFFSPDSCSPSSLNETNGGVPLVFRQMKGKAWKSSQNNLSVISATISRDNTAGEEVRRAKLFSEFGRKIQSKTVTFDANPPQSFQPQERLDFTPPMTFDAQQDEQNTSKASGTLSEAEQTGVPSLLRGFGTNWQDIAKHIRDVYRDSDDISTAVRKV